MFNKIYDYFKNFIKVNYKQLIFLVVLYFVLTFPLPYYISTTGGTIKIDDRIKIEESYNGKGSFNLAYVTEIRATVPTYLLSYIIPSWELSKMADYQVNDNETMEDISIRDKYYLKEATQAAVYVAYTRANKEFTLKGNSFIVYSVSPNANSKIRVGQELISIDGEKNSDLEKYREIVNAKKVGDTVELVLKENGKEVKLKTPIFLEEEVKRTGISFFNILDYETDPKIELKFKASESGPSGGLTTTLAIYNKLVKEDITKGKQIVGTGTIDIEGNVGSIGGVKYKLMGAVKAKADVFIVPKGENYEECIKIAKKKNYKIKIIGVSTFDEAIEELAKLK